MNFKIINGNSATVLQSYPDNHFDSIVCDPPYGINFLGKDWDKNTGEEEVYRQCLRVLKPGGYLLAFSAARTYHHLAMAVERSGFQIRDQIMWVYGTGFPKSQDVGKQIQKMKQVIASDPIAKYWSGYGSALKPAHEPIVLAQKPMTQSLYKNVLEHSVGALNIDGCKVGDGGRYPANFIHDGSDVGLGSASRFFYCAKVSRSERNIGCEDVEPQYKEAANFRPNHLEKALNGQDGNPYGRYRPINNNHPTVKPVELMKYLIKLVTPPRGHVLDPFAGSGSTGMAAVELQHQFTGIELDRKYCEIATKRITAWHLKCVGVLNPELWHIPE